MLPKEALDPPKTSSHGSTSHIGTPSWSPSLRVFALHIPFAGRQPKTSHIGMPANRQFGPLAAFPFKANCFVLRHPKTKTLDRDTASQSIQPGFQAMKSGVLCPSTRNCRKAALRSWQF